MDYLTYNIICNLAQTNKYLVAQYLSYEVAKNVFESILMSTHLVEQKLKTSPEMLEKKIQLFSAEQDVILNGRKAGYNMAETKGIAQIIQGYMNSGDDCIVCESGFAKNTAGF